MILKVVLSFYDTYEVKSVFRLYIGLYVANDLVFLKQTATQYIALKMEPASVTLSRLC